MSHLSWWMLGIKGQDSFGVARVVAGPGGAPKPLGHGILINFFRMGPGGVICSRIQSHRVISCLQGLNASTEVRLEQIQTHHSTMDQCNDCNDQDRQLALLLLINSQ